MGKDSGIEKVYVINLDREPGRWSKMEQELRHILDSSGAELLNLTERYVAVDANEFSQELPKDADIEPFYTLGDQLFVEPQPLALPSRLELNTPIRMSRAEIAGSLQLTEKQTTNTFDRFSDQVGTALELLGKGLCSQDMKERFKALICARAERLGLSGHSWS